MRLLSSARLQLLRRATGYTPRLVAASLPRPTTTTNRLPPTATAHLGASFHSLPARNYAYVSNVDPSQHDGSTQQPAEDASESETIDEEEEKIVEVQCYPQVPLWEREIIEDYFGDTRFQKQYFSQRLTNQQAEALKRFVLGETNDAVETAEAMASEVQGLQAGDDYHEALGRAWVSINGVACDLPYRQPQLAKLLNAMYSLGDTLRPLSEDEDLPNLEWANAGLSCVEHNLLHLVYRELSNLLHPGPGMHTKKKKARAIFCSMFSLRWIPPPKPPPRGERLAHGSNNKRLHVGGKHVP